MAKNSQCRIDSKTGKVTALLDKHPGIMVIEDNIVTYRVTIYCNVLDNQEFINYFETYCN